jgi:hypothetical protein
MLITWTLVVFLNGQPFVYPKEIPTSEECSAMEGQILTMLVPNTPHSDNPQTTSIACGRTDLSVYKPASTN